MSEVVLEAHDLVVVIAQPRDGEDREDIISRAFDRIVRSKPLFKRWTERRVRTHLTKELINDPHRVRQMEVDDLRRAAAPIKERANAAARYLLDQRARLLSSPDPAFHREQLMAIEHALGAMGVVDLPRIKAGYWSGKQARN